jgi:hypothetical protein
MGQSTFAVGFHFGGGGLLTYSNGLSASSLLDKAAGRF